MLSGGIELRAVFDSCTSTGGEVWRVQFKEVCASEAHGQEGDVASKLSVAYVACS